MPIMAAGMHDASVATDIRTSLGFAHRQRIHIGSQPEGFLSFSHLERADHTGTAKAAGHFISPLRQVICDYLTGAMFW